MIWHQYDNQYFWLNWIRETLNKLRWIQLTIRMADNQTKPPKKKKKKKKKKSRDKAQ